MKGIRRIWAGSAVAVLAALILAACGGGTASPSPVPGGGGGGGGGQQPPPVVNTAPQIKSITVSDTRVEVGTPVTITAVVEDAETPVANLEFRWSAETGTISGNTATVTWTPGSDAKTPADYVITLTVIEAFTSQSFTLENKATSTVTARVNNSSKELADMSLRFLGDFVNSKVSADKCVAEFSDSCRGKKDELADIEDNRHDFEIIASTLRPLSLSIASDRLSATVHTFCSFTSKVITANPREESCAGGKCPLGSIQGPVTGDCFTTNVYEKGRWWLCESHIGPLPGTTLHSFARALFHMDRHELHSPRPERP